MENRFKILAAVQAALIASMAVNAFASFQDAPVSIKAEGMGGAFVAMANDPTTLFINPAGLATLNHTEASLMYGSPLAGTEGVSLHQGYSVLGVPINHNFSVGAGVTMFQATGLLSEYQYMGGISGLIADKVAVGTNINYLYHSYDIASDPAYSGSSVFSNGHSKGAVGVDFGLLALVAKNVQVGFSIRNANSPDVGLSQRDPVARDIRGGAMYRTKYANFLADLEQRSDIGIGLQENTWHLGAEVPFQSVSLRMGANSNGFTAGFGVQLGFMRLDYAFAMMTNVQTSNAGTQLLSLTLRMGGKAAESQDSSRSKKSDYNYLDDVNGVFYGIR